MRYKWLHINEVPLLYPESNVSKQLQIELWLDVSPMLEALELKRVEHPKKRPEIEAYVV